MSIKQVAVGCAVVVGDLVCISSNNVANLFSSVEIAEGRQMSSCAFKAEIKVMGVSPNADLVVAYLKDGSLLLKSFSDATLLRKLFGLVGHASKLTFSACGQFIIAGSHGGAVNLWSSETGGQCGSVGCGGDVYGLALLPGQGMVIAGTYEGRLVTLSTGAQKLSEVDLSAGGNKNVTALACGGSAVVVGYRSGLVEMRDSSRTLDRPAWSSSFFSDMVADVCVSASTNQVAVVGRRTTTQAILSLATGETLRLLSSPQRNAIFARFLSGGARVMTWSKEDHSGAVIWALHGGEKEIVLDHEEGSKPATKGAAQESPKCCSIA